MNIFSLVNIMFEVININIWSLFRFIWFIEQIIWKWDWSHVLWHNFLDVEKYSFDFFILLICTPFGFEFTYGLLLVDSALKIVSKIVMYAFKMFKYFISWGIILGL